ncbi:GGDEF domain-containing protein [Halopseudomonas salegens]|uniref:diguanylate cyclase n=1 Tax=Halopseudomonas salegens TaxID=1434072 RepID=A0A1H2EQI5_9GAMM|nr:sensor domain-containing diguanylate cyclase [Halopseudomonas salegens]SDT97351.1 PAS domain S-box-containing protein/diguanylate cyclase (GGDEF) domain-containing protein [Halopseudomonas salegens]
MTEAASSMEKDSAVYKTLLESTKAIPWKIDWKSMAFEYIGPQIEELLGWSQDSWKSVEDWATRMHPEDQSWVVDFCVAQSQSGIDHEADYRALTSDGGYVWIRDVVHVVRDEAGEVEALVGFMFDISERKKTEEKLARLQKELEELSFKDGLTGVANRRMFDSIMQVEWTNARRNAQPLSIIMFDIDYFKQYNDLYGHLQGDECLKQIARLLESAAARSRDFFARYGGEEFVMVLPETDAHSAATVAERCRKLIFKEQISHEASPVSQVLTVSMGTATLVPSAEDKLMDFIESADRQLYRAKESGRNCVVHTA